jgi:hypothetical protein
LFPCCESTKTYMDPAQIMATSEERKEKEGREKRGWA